MSRDTKIIIKKKKTVEAAVEVKQTLTLKQNVSRETQLSGWMMVQGSKQQPCCQRFVIVVEGVLLCRRLPVLTCFTTQGRCRNSHTGPDIAPSLQPRAMVTTQRGPLFQDKC